MKKSTLLILSILILFLLTTGLIFRHNQKTVSPENIVDISTETEESESVESEPESESETKTEPESETISKLHISGTDFESMDIALSDEQNGIITAYTLTTDTLDQVDVSNNMFDQLVNALPTIEIKDVLADNVTDLSLYGLDQPRLHLVIDFYDPNIANETNTISNPSITSTLDFKWGNILEDGKIAFMKTGETNVYAMDSSFLDNLSVIATPFNVASKFIALSNISEVKSIDIAFPDISYTVAIDDATHTYLVNNTPLEEDVFKPLYRSIIGIYGEVVLEEDLANTPPEITITYTFHDDSTKIVTFTPSTNSEYYTSILHDSIVVGCSNTQLDDLKTALQDALTNKSL